MINSNKKSQPNHNILISTEEISKRTILFLQSVLVMTIPLAILNLIQTHYISSALVVFYSLCNIILIVFTKKGFLKYTQPATIIIASVFFACLTVLQGRARGSHVFLSLNIYYTFFD